MVAHVLIVFMLNLRLATFFTVVQLKSLAEVARVIDDVDNEEWLFLFIEQLDTHLHDLIKFEPRDQVSEPQ